MCDSGRRIEGNDGGGRGEEGEQEADELGDDRPEDEKDRSEEAGPG